MSERLPFLRTDGLNLVDERGKVVVLRGINLGGAFVFEPWMAAMKLDRTGLAGEAAKLPDIRDEVSLWRALLLRVGSEKSGTLRRVWRNAWANERDIARVAALGLNCVRIPLWYGMVASQFHLHGTNPEGLAILDRLLDACGQHGVYAILDLHGAPGCQSKEDHTGETGRNELFKNPTFQEWTAEVWRGLATRYKNRPEVAGYDLLNEPTGAPDTETLIRVHDKLYRAIREVDKRHVILVEDGYFGDKAFPDPKRQGWENVAYSFHHYLWEGRSLADHERFIADKLSKWRETQERLAVPLYVGEFSAVRPDWGGVKSLAAYLRAFNRYGWSWSPWTYKQVEATDGRVNFWGLYTNTQPFARPDPYRDDFETLKTRFGAYDTARLSLRPDYAGALKAAARPAQEVWLEPIPAPADGYVANESRRIITVAVRLHNATGGPVQGFLRTRLPDGWHTENALQPFSLAAGDSTTLRAQIFAEKAPLSRAPAVFSAEVSGYDIQPVEVQIEAK